MCVHLGENEAYDRQERPSGHYDPSRVGGVSMTPNEAVPSPLSAKNQGHSIVYNSQGKGNLNTINVYIIKLHELSRHCKSINIIKCCKKSSSVYD